ncbi:NUDIX hydrolase [Exiguobacterium sp. SH3S1]|uniref:NUDIX hydrolase n=1 Tax=Exiguobacterium sp. SH3S1 TaxID=2510955 RepID=UPI00103DA2F9|nr:NUDIX domain-containing protein [Exiguobacterium sp. SH3S1]TCI64158.1 NUDIX domain-containing protein [Exiguobacterium sp. SH3S1]
MDIVFPTNQGTFNYRVAGIWVKDGHLLVHRNINDDFWALPGGRVAIGEQAELALMRELEEELNATLTGTTFACVSENFFTYLERTVHEIGMYFYVSGDLPLRTGDFHGPEGDHLIYRWQPLEQLRELTLYPETLYTLPETLPPHFIDR